MREVVHVKLRCLVSPTSMSRQELVQNYSSHPADVELP